MLLFRIVVNVLELIIVLNISIFVNGARKSKDAGIAIVYGEFTSTNSMQYLIVLDWTVKVGSAQVTGSFYADKRSFALSTLSSD